MAKRLITLLALWLFSSLALAASAPRVITLAPHLTELAFAAGITPVAVSAWSDYPPEAKSLEQVANWQGIKLERILALKPDLVLAWRGGSPQRQIDQLRALGVKVIWLDPDSIESIVAALHQLAAWSPSPQQAHDAADRLAARFKALQQHNKQPKHRRVFLQFGQQPLFTAARATLQNQLLTLCGGENVFAASPVPWPQVSREQVLARHPELIIVPGDSHAATQTARFWQPQLSVPVIAIPEDWLSRPGPRSVLAAEKLCQALQ
ncbi:vitamin B12 ABC transporter substrate-binding protein BtuF [Pantoea alhagi]|uniref:Vitamin B12-binding protein n=1 Tax=Pantoea alhagi TaxID=1891675 RepID=A0A1W6B1X9_9GAMM|nr:vitamin B12 ABC transporter substrate-binding protein BtuF [Pantoea alhagi]ARJ41087.1 vitamin B12 ABC transporter substrate-binding protein BtuF [Pantoea alhagi]